jgi:hypothetical protein
MPNTYDIGDLVICDAKFTDAETGAAQDPTVVTFEYKEPDDTVTTRIYPVNVIKTATGCYEASVDISAALARPQGEWFYRWAGSGAVGQSAAEGRFMVRASHF